jgi:hypothetical protein
MLLKCHHVLKPCVTIWKCVRSTYDEVVVLTFLKWLLGIWVSQGVSE